jgi:hypothetical protein
VTGDILMIKKENIFTYLLVLIAIVSLAAVMGCKKDENNEEDSGVFTPDSESPPANSVYLDLDDTSGDNFTLAVKANDLSNVYGIYFDLNFDGAIIEFVSSAEGDFCSKGSSTFFFATGKSNSVVVGVSRQADAGGTSGDGTICKLTFRGSTAGNSRLDFSRNNVVDPNNNAIPGVSWFGGTATIVP